MSGSFSSEIAPRVVGTFDAGGPFLRGAKKDATASSLGASPVPSSCFHIGCRAKTRWGGDESFEKALRQCLHDVQVMVAEGATYYRG